MPPRQHPPLGPRPYLRVDLRRGDRPVAQELLDEPDVHSFFQQKCRRGVPQHVRGHVEKHPGVPGVPAERGSHGLLRELGAVSVAEEGGVGLVILLPEGQVVFQGSEGLFVAELEDPLSSSFAQMRTLSWRRSTSWFFRLQTSPTLAPVAKRSSMTAMSRRRRR